MLVILKFFVKLIVCFTSYRLKDAFLRNIRECSSSDSVDGKFAVLDSEGEEVC